MKTRNFFNQLKSFPQTFWTLNLLQTLEKMAYVVVLLQMPIYIAQKDVAGGMYLDQTLKGVIFFVWAMVQRITPVFTGGYADKLGYRKTLFFSFFVITISYIILGFAGEFWIFMAGVLFLGFGSGVFLPPLQAALSGTMNSKNESLGWGVYFMFLNLGVFFAPIISKSLKEIDWIWVFYGSALIFSLNFIILLFVRDIKKSETARYAPPSPIIKNIARNFLDAGVAPFILLMSGFVMIYMQFYETFPNFFVDWVNTSDFVETFNIPSIATVETSRGVMFSYEWIRNLNSGLIILAVAPISWLAAKIHRGAALTTGCLIATAGLLLCGSSMDGFVVMGGVMVYTLGELIVNPKFVEQINCLAKKGQKALYMSYLNISFAIGLGGGALLGGYIYKEFGEKANLAAKYLAERYGIDSIPLTQSFDKLMKTTGLSAGEATELLWRTYTPYLLWTPFAAVGVIAAIGLFAYFKRQKKAG